MWMMWSASSGLRNCNTQRVVDKRDQYKGTERVLVMWMMWSASSGLRNYEHINHRAAEHEAGVCLGQRLLMFPSIIVSETAAMLM
jgi:hypothetical protein